MPVQGPGLSFLSFLSFLPSFLSFFLPSRNPVRLSFFSPLLSPSSDLSSSKDPRVQGVYLPVLMFPSSSSAALIPSLDEFFRGERKEIGGDVRGDGSGK